MYPDRGIVCTYRWQSGLSTRPEDPNTPTCQFITTKDSHRDRPCFAAPLHGILTISWTHYAYVYGYVYVYGLMHIRHHHDHCEHCTTASRALLFLYQVSDARAIIGILISVVASVSDWIQSKIPDLIRLNCGFNLIRLNCGFGLIILNCFFIQFNSRLTYLFSI